MWNRHVSNLLSLCEILCHFDELAATPLLTSPCQPDLIRALESDPSKGTFQLLFGGNLDNGADGLHIFLCHLGWEIRPFSSSTNMRNTFSKKWAQKPFSSSLKHSTKPLSVLKTNKNSSLVRSIQNDETAKRTQSNEFFSSDFLVQKQSFLYKSFSFKWKIGTAIYYFQKMWWP